MGEVLSLVSLMENALPTTMKALRAKCVLSNTASRVLWNEEWHNITCLVTLGLGGRLLTQNHLTSTQRIRTHLVQDTSLYDLANDRSHEHAEPVQNINCAFILVCSWRHFLSSQSTLPE